MCQTCFRFFESLSLVQCDGMQQASSLVLMYRKEVTGSCQTSRQILLLIK